MHVEEVEEDVSHASTCTQRRPSSYMLVSKMRWSTCGVGSLDCPEREYVGPFCTWSMGGSMSMANGMCVYLVRGSAKVDGVSARGGEIIVVVAFTKGNMAKKEMCQLTTDDLYMY